MATSKDKDVEITELEAPVEVKTAEPEVKAEADTEVETGKTVFEDTEHVQYNLTVDPNDPRNRPATPKLPSLNDPGQS